MSCVKTDEIVTLFTMHIAGTVLYNQHFLVTTSTYAYASNFGTALVN